MEPISYKCTNFQIFAYFNTFYTRSEYKKKTKKSILKVRYLILNSSDVLISS